MPWDTEKRPLSALTGVRIRRVNFRNCPLYTGENNSVKVKKKKKTRTITARRSVGNKRLLLYVFVIVKTEKVEFQNPLSVRMPMNSKGSMKYSCLIFSLHAVSCNFIFFFCTDLCIWASRDLIE